MKTGLITCGALLQEVKQIIKKYDINADVVGISPEDHMFPMRISPDVEKRINTMKGQYDHLAVVYGECGTRGALDELITQYNMFRIDSQNCYEMYAGEKYHQFREEEIGTFFLTDFLVRTFSNAVINGLGLDKYPELKKEYFHNCTRIVYLIQNDSQRLREKALSIAEFMELPIEFFVTGLGGLEDRVLELINRTEHKYGMPSYKTSCCANNNIINELLFTTQKQATVY